MKQGTSLGSQLGRWIILAAMVALLGALLFTTRPAGAQDNGTIEFPENSDDPVITFSAGDPEDDTPISWSMPTTVPSPLPAGFVDADFTNDAEDFDISQTGVLTFDVNGDADTPDVSAPPDFENPVDSNTDNTYMVVVQASDPEALGPANTYHKVVVEVTNVDEDGKVTWTIDHDPDTDPVDTEADTPTLLQFQPGDMVWATVSDGDISGADKTVNNAIWRWYRSPTKSLTGGTLIEGATTRNYTVQDRTGSDDVGMYLRAEASYTDGSGPVVTASRVSDYPIQAYRTNNETPTFGADTSTARSMNEGMKGMMVGAPVTATDANGDVLNYTISSNVQVNALNVFKIDQKTGQITTEVALDFDTAQDPDQASDFAGVAGNATGDNIYLVRVRATDSSGAATDNDNTNTVPDDMTVIITLKNVNEKPAFGAIDATTTPDANVLSQTIAENATGDGLQVANYTASDTDANDTVLISLRGEDMSMFQLADDSDDTASAAHILSFRTSPNYEDPKDRDGDNVYKVTVRASDRGNLYVEKFLTVRVTNVDEAPSFMANTPTSYKFAENGKEAVATFSATDPEGANITWSVPAAPSPLPTGFLADDFADQEDFDISATGVLTFDVGGDTDAPDASVSPDYENAGDADTDNTYNVVVAAADADSGATGVQTGYHKVTVMVTEVAEDGKVTWTVDHDGGGADTPTLVQFQDGAVLEATATDGDENGADKDISARADWQWYKSSSSSSCGTDALASADGAQSTTYTVQAEDRGNYLCAKATYTIGGISYSAYKVSDYKVGRDLSTNNANPTFGPDTSTTRMVYEGKKGMMVGDPVIATDADSAASLGDQLNYTLVTNPTVTVGGATLNVFEIDQETGQITTNVDLDYDPPTVGGATPTRSYTVTVRATDSAGAATDDGSVANTVPNDMEVTIALKNVNEKPTFTLPTAANLRTAIDVPEGNTVLWSADAATNAFSAGSADNVTYAAADLDDGDTAILVLDGPDKDLFELSATATEGNFILSFTNAGKPDYENPMDDGQDNRYNVIVRATDGTLNADRMIAVNVTDENEGPDLTRGGVNISGPTSREYAEGGTDTVATYTARGSEADSAAWTVEGTDAGAFDIGVSSGELTFSPSPDFENPTDEGRDNEYNVTVVATSGEHMDTHDVTVTVTNVDEDGTVTLMPASPVAGNAVTAELSDPDGGETNITWQWSSSADGMAGTFTDIAGATTASYTPAAPMYLMAMATYEDVHGSQSATSDSVGVMDLTVSGSDAVDYAENGTGDVAAYTANASGAAWTLSGADMDDLSISSTGVLTFDASPDYEAPTDADTNNVYMVTVMAAVGNATATMDVAVTVTNVDEGPVQRYDADDNGTIDTTELFNAVDAFFAGQIPIDDLFEVIDAYFG